MTQTRLDPIIQFFFGTFLHLVSMQEESDIEIYAPHPSPSPLSQVPFLDEFILDPLSLSPPHTHTHTRTHTQFLSHSISHFESYYLLCLYLNLTRLEVLLSLSNFSLYIPLSNSLSKFLSLFLSNLHTHSLSLCHILSLSLSQAISFTAFHSLRSKAMVRITSNKY